jgi:hypothetical protein
MLFANICLLRKTALYDLGLRKDAFYARTINKERIVDKHDVVADLNKN